MKLIKRILYMLRGEQPISKLINRGLKIGENYTIMSGCIIDPSHCWHIEIGDNFWLGHYSQIICHDASTKMFIGYTKVGNIKIGHRVFIGAGSIVLPGITIGDDVIIAAGSVVSHDIPSNSVAMGIPAKVVDSLADYILKEKSLMNEENCFGEEYTLRNPNFGKKEMEIIKNVCQKYLRAYVK